MCDCIIGLLGRGYNHPELTTLNGLRRSIKENIEYNEVILPKFSSDDRLKAKVWTLKDYGDFRKRTNLTRFKYCPYCGKEINWKEIRGIEDA